MRRPALALLLPLAALAASLACNLRQVTADQAMAATLLNVPSRAVDPFALGAPDAGAGVDAGTITLPGQTAALVFLGELRGGVLDADPAPIDGAEVQVGPEGGGRAALARTAPGTYTTTSLQTPGLTYQSGATYDFAARADGEDYLGKVPEVPAEERIAELREMPKRLSPGQPLTLTRPAPPAGKERPLGFVTVTRLGPQGQPEGPTYTSLPTTPIDVLRLGLDPEGFRAASVEVPASAFPEARKSYLVVFHSATLGRPESDNLSVLSVLLAGTADVGVVRVE
jgi:hypothetical protein